MKTPGRDTRKLEELLGKYRFTQPIPEDVRDGILSSKKRVFVRVLKSVGAFSAIQGVFLSLYFAMKKGGIGATALKIAISGIAAVGLSLGGYFGVNAVVDTFFSGNRENAPARDERGERWEDEIMLFDGRIIRGAIISRGESYRVRTDRGVIVIPRTQIKAVRPTGR